MNREQATTETEVNPETQESQETSPVVVESPEELRQGMLEESEKEIASFTAEGAERFAQLETRAKEEGSAIDIADNGALTTLGKEVNLAKAALQVEIGYNGEFAEVASVKNELAKVEPSLSGENHISAEVEGTKNVEEDSRYKAIYEKEAFLYLKNYDSKYFHENFSGISEDSYLLGKNGNRTNLLPSQNIPSFKNGLTFSKFGDKVKEKFFDQYPDAEASSRNVPIEQVFEERKEKAKKKLGDEIYEKMTNPKLAGYSEQHIIAEYLKDGTMSQEEIDSLRKEVLTYAKSREDFGKAMWPGSAKMFTTPETETVNQKEESVTMSQGENLRGIEQGSIEEKVLEQFKNIGIHGEVVTIPDNSTFNEVMLFPKNLSNEKLVRLYRGLTSLDESVVNQVSPSMRLELGDRKVTTLDLLRNPVEKLTENPSYQNLIDYVESVKAHLSDREKSSLEFDLQSIENKVLEGSSIRRVLVSNHLSYPGGVPVSGISPYVSSTKNPLEAGRYSSQGGGIVVIDIPASKLESLGGTSSEVNIKAFLSPEYITAILPTKNNKGENFNEQDLYNAIALVDSKIPTTHIEIPSLSEEEIQREKNQGQTDRVAIQEKKSNDLRKRFPEVAISNERLQKAMTEINTDIYSVTRFTIFDYFENQLKRLHPRSSLEEYGFQAEVGIRGNEKFNRKNITDVMLLKARDFVKRMEQREVKN